MQSVKTTSPLNREIAPLFRGRHPSEPKLPLATGFDQNNVFAKSRCEIHSHRLFCFMHFADDPAEFLLFSRKIAPGARMSPGGASVCHKNLRGKQFYPKNVPIFVSLRGRGAAVAILKFEVWHPVAKHGSTKQKRIPITKKHGFAASSCFLSLHSKVLFRSAQPYFISGWQIVPLKIAASGAKNAPSSQ